MEMVVFYCNHEVQRPYVIRDSLPPYQAQNPGNYQQTVHRVSAPIMVDDATKRSITGALSLSCAVFWLFGGLFGGIAFILAMKGRSCAKSGDKEKAKSYLKASYVLSAAGVLVGMVVLMSALFGLGYLSIANSLHIIVLIMGLVLFIITVVFAYREMYYGSYLHYYVPSYF